VTISIKRINRHIYVYNEHAEYFLWDGNWIFKYYLGYVQVLKSHGDIFGELLKLRITRNFCGGCKVAYCKMWIDLVGLLCTIVSKWTLTSSTKIWIKQLKNGLMKFWICMNLVYIRYTWVFLLMKLTVEDTCSVSCEHSFIFFLFSKIWNTLRF
jgi:hypothetical protein